MLRVELRGLVEQRHVRASSIMLGASATLKGAILGKRGGWKAEPRILGNYLLKLGSVCLGGCCLHEKNMNHLYPVRFNSISLTRDTSVGHPS